MTRYITAALFVASAALVVAVGYAIAVWFLSFGTYVETVIP